MINTSIYRSHHKRPAVSNSNIEVPKIHSPNSRSTLTVSEGIRNSSPDWPINDDGSR